MSDTTAKKLFFLEDPDNWPAEFTKRLTAYQQLVDDLHAREKKFDEERRSALEALRGEWLAELKEPEELLFDVAPILKDDIDAIPTMRAAYSDRTAAMMAKISMLTYVAFEDAKKKKVLDEMLDHGRVKLLETVIADETEALVANTSKFVVVAFRGTTSREDARTDLQARFNMSDAEVDGRKFKVSVHSGFYHAFQRVQARIEELLANTDKEKPIYLTGHSLGGALALVASAALASSLGDRIAAVYTFGAPRVGKRDFAEAVKAPHYRVINMGDIVPLVPPTWLRGYAHTGMPILLKEGATRALRRTPWGTAIMYGLLSVLLWPITRQLMFIKRHETTLYVSRLDKIARHRARQP